MWSPPLNLSSVDEEDLHILASSVSCRMEDGTKEGENKAEAKQVKIAAVMRPGEAWTRAEAIDFSASMSPAIDGPHQWVLCLQTQLVMEYQRTFVKEVNEEETMEPLIFFSYYISWWFWGTYTCPRHS